MTSTTIANRDDALLLLALHWDAAAQTAREITSPIIAWTLEPGRPPRPISLLGDLQRSAWCVIDGSSPDGPGYIPGRTVFLARADAVRELSIQARTLAEASQ
jgi:hypothetical protein